MLCPHCQKKIDDELIRHEGARLMNASRTNRARDPKVMSEIGRTGGRRPKTAAGRKARKKEIADYQAEIRALKMALANNTRVKR